MERNSPETKQRSTVAPSRADGGEPASEPDSKKSDLDSKKSEPDRNWSIRNSFSWMARVFCTPYKLGLFLVLLAFIFAIRYFAALRNYIPSDFVNKHQIIDGMKALGRDGRNAINLSKLECESIPLKVYMYDLPRKYNMGLLKKDDPDQKSPWKHSVAPPWILDHDQVDVQHSVEYWLMVYLLNARDRENGKKAAVRVNDPTQADVFFVPFFSSWSFIALGIKMTGPGAETDKGLQAEVVDILHKAKWWQASQGRDHVIVTHHPNAFRHYREMLNQSIFIVADFGRSDKTVARLSKDVVAPYVHVLPSYSEDNSNDSYHTRKTLLFFRGRTHRKADGWVRATLAELLSNQPDVQYTDSVDVDGHSTNLSMEGMRSSRFCLHPAGDTPSSCRLFDAIVNHCVPVIISDKIELPFEDDLDYSKFALFFSSEQAIKPGHLLGTLRSMKPKEWSKMWTRLKAVSHHFEFQHPSKDDAVNMIFKQVQRKLPAQKLGIHRSKRLRIPDWW